jgi:hypothetical protein
MKGRFMNRLPQCRHSIACALSHREKRVAMAAVTSWQFGHFHPDSMTVSRRGAYRNTMPPEEVFHDLATFINPS